MAASPGSGRSARRPSSTGTPALPATTARAFGCSSCARIHSGSSRRPSSARSRATPVKVFGSTGRSGVAGVDDLYRAAGKGALALEGQAGVGAEPVGQAHPAAEQDRADHELELVERPERAIGLDRARPADQ